MLLKGNKLYASYSGDVDVLSGITVEIKESEVVCLLGANGAGKTSLVSTISGLLPISKGSIVFNGIKIDKKPPNERVRIGISMCPEGRKLFNNLTVLENIKLGAYLRNDKNGIFESMEYCFKLFPILKKRQRQIAGTMSGGEQQMLALSRALMSKPKLLILDEPTLGLAPLIIDEIYDVIKEIVSSGITLILVEQNASKALAISQRGYVLETGKIVIEGTREELMNNPRVREAYLGG